VSFAIDFFRQRLRAACGMAASGDRELARAAERAEAGRPLAIEHLARAIERSLEALSHIDSNAHQATLVECWLDDLTKILQGQFVAAYAEY
jgi:hypothetical protein